MAGLQRGEPADAEYRLAVATAARWDSVPGVSGQSEGISHRYAVLQCARRWGAVGFHAGRPHGAIAIRHHRSVVAAGLAIRCRRIGASAARSGRESRFTQRRLSCRRAADLRLWPPSAKAGLLSPLLALGR